MDTETSKAIGTLRADLRRVEATLSAKIDASVGASASALRGEVGGIRAETGQIQAEMGEMRSEMNLMRRDMATMRVEMMRHTQLLFESLRNDIRTIAEGLVSLDPKVE